MKILIIVFLWLPCFSVAQSAKIPPELNWLIGTWNRISNDSSVEGTEAWITGKEEWTGISTSIRNGDTIVTERMRLKIYNSKIEYIADVKGYENPVSFSIKSHSDSGFVCENPLHDYPKKIEYKLKGRSLIVTISGDGKMNEFNFVRCGN